MYYQMTPFIAFNCNKERSYERRSVTMANTNGYIFLNFRLAYSCDKGFTVLVNLKWILG